MEKSNDIKKLSPYEHIRLRTTMYYGSTNLHTQQVLNFVDNVLNLTEVSWVPAVFTVFREILDNSLDEVVAYGYGNRIDINYDNNNMIFEIEDNGRGIPIDWDIEHKLHKATLALSEIMTGRNFENRGNTAGQNGIGAAGTNFCSEYFNVEIHRDDKKFYQEFTEGNEVFGNSLQIKTPKITKSLDKTGTKITFKLSKNVFSDLTLPENFLKSRVYEIAICNPKIKIFYNGEHVKVKDKPEQSLFPGKKIITVFVTEMGFKSKFWIVPNFVESGEHCHSLVNNIPTFNGGVHIDIFKKLFFSNLLAALEKESKKRKLSPNKSDISERVLIYNITKMDKPDFDSQSKTRLINESVSTHIKKTLENEELFKDIIKNNKDWIEEIYKRCEERTHKKDVNDLNKATRKNLRNKVPGLMDATGSDRTKCVLFLAEGESAISGCASARDPDIHGGLGLRGKVMNVNGEHPKKIIENKALSEIMSSIGLVIGQKVNRKELRYGKVYLATDMDQDGFNIAALLVNFFYSYWPDLFDKIEEPFIYLFMSPFIIADKGKIRKYWYGHDYKDFKPEDYRGWNITRAKGLGTLTSEDWEHSLKKPIVIPLLDDGKLLDSLDLVFNGKRSDDRKNWIGI